MKPVLIALVLAVLALAAGCGAAQKSSTGPREVQLAVTDRGFEPARTEIARGQALTLVVTRKTDQTCAKEIVIPRLSERHALPLNQPVRVEIPAGVVADTLNYVCGMNMLGGSIVAK